MARGVWARITGGLGLAVLLACSGCGASKEAQRPTPRESPSKASGAYRIGEASWYGKRFQGRTTASGERFDRNQLTAAHRKLRFGTCVNVENLSNGRKVKVRINDRGPYAGGRIIDVSEAAARKLDMIEAGVARVRLRPC
jgi:rare lipoprotein A